ncbi:MAG TPA: universal stress protein [Nostocaceae cyanobacterium]|nr:universal stress protein [Nostocaceae cyanobacterium]
MLARFQSMVGRDDLIEQMVLLPEQKKLFAKRATEKNSIKLIVGYNASPKSHTALDIAFCLAHQTHLATNIKVTIQAVYVTETKPRPASETFRFTKNSPVLECSVNEPSRKGTLVLTPPKLEEVSLHLPEKSVNDFKEADQVLWEAKSLAQEWQETFKSHLRFGSLSEELNKVVQLESADALLLGCHSADHPLIDKLGSSFPCTVLGIPRYLD